MLATRGQARARNWCTAALLVVALASGARSNARADTAASIAQTRAAIAATQARLAAKRAQLEFERKRESDFTHQLAETNGSIAVVRGRLSDLGGRIAQDEAAEVAEQQALAAALVALDRQRAAFGRRVVEMYEAPQEGSLDVLFSATSFVDLTERWDDLRFVAAQDHRDVTARQATVARVAALREAIAETVASLQADRDAQTQVASQLDALAAQRSNLLAGATHDRVAVVADVSTLEEISAQEEAQLEALIKAQEEALERERQQGQAPALTQPQTGEMQWPLHGPITSPFGMRLNPFGGGNTEFHPGIDIGVDVGTTVAAAAAGRVIIAGWVSGYGEYIAIDHGGGISTGYGHLSQFYVTVGQDVQRGQAIGASGNTGRSTGPHLIFEVRRNGTPVDPNPYLQ